MAQKAGIRCLAFCESILIRLLETCQAAHRALPFPSMPQRLPEELLRSKSKVRGDPPVARTIRQADTLLRLLSDFHMRKTLGSPCEWEETNH